MSNLNAVMLRGKIIPESISQSKEAGEVVVEFSVSTHYDFRRAEDELVREKSSIPCVATGNVGATIKRKAAKGKEVEIHGSLREYKLFTPMGSCSTVKVVCESVR